MEKLFNNPKVRNQANQIQTQIMIERRNPLFALKEGKRPTLANPVLAIFILANLGQSNLGQSIFGHLGFGPANFGPNQFWPIDFWIWCVSWWSPEGEGANCGAQTQKKSGPEAAGVSHDSPKTRNVHIRGSRPSKTPPKFHEKTPRE